MPPTPPTPLEQALANFPRVGRDRAEQLSRLGLVTIQDLLLQRPRRYEDRRNLCPIKSLSKDEPQLCHGIVVTKGVKRFRGGRQAVFECVLDDNSAQLHLRWWNMPYIENYFNTGDEVLAYGKPSSLKPRTMDHPETEVFTDTDEARIHLDRVVPVYPLTEGLPQRWMRQLAWRVVEQFAKEIDEPDSNIPQLLHRSQAIRQIHFPEELEDAENARRRLALDELIVLQKDIHKRRANLETNAKSRSCMGENKWTVSFTEALPFKLTPAQSSVIKEITTDLSTDLPMRRLLQGDVGSGKTVVAAMAILKALESGYNALLMAPTEILAEQHRHTFRQWFEPLGLQVAMQTGSHHEVDTHPTLLNKGNPLLVVGTHALFQSRFELDNIGLVAIDEQHKFGVEQRNELLRKGDYPHLLVMTATPIPRTLGLTLYGDLDISTIRELPTGRGQVRTHMRTAERWPKIVDFINNELDAGKQAYVVFPRVDNADDNVKAVTREAEKLAKVFQPHAIGILHGRLKATEKEAVMDGFREGRIRVLLATTVIEVGVDVPNANLMLVENAEQFGLAQLHQLRGRIGRGEQDAHFIMVTGVDSPESAERLEVLVNTHDGFEIAEADLRLRGPGELLGQDQSGLPTFRFADLRRDLDLIRQARDLVLKA